MGKSTKWVNHHLFGTRMENEMLTFVGTHELFGVWIKTIYFTSTCCRQSVSPYVFFLSWFGPWRDVTKAVTNKDLTSNDEKNISITIQDFKTHEHCTGWSSTGIPSLMMIIPNLVGGLEPRNFY